VSYIHCGDVIVLQLTAGCCCWQWCSG